MKQLFFLSVVMSLLLTGTILGGGCSDSTESDGSGNSDGDSDSDSDGDGDDDGDGNNNISNGDNDGNSTPNRNCGGVCLTSSLACSNSNGSADIGALCPDPSDICCVYGANNPSIDTNNNNNNNVPSDNTPSDNTPSDNTPSDNTPSDATSSDTTEPMASDTSPLACKHQCISAVVCTTSGGERIDEQTCAEENTVCCLIPSGDDTETDTVTEAVCTFTCVAGPVDCVTAQGTPRNDLPCPDDGLCCDLGITDGGETQNTDNVDGGIATDTTMETDTQLASPTDTTETDTGENQADASAL